MSKYFIIHKPFQVLSQFSESGNKKTLKDFFKVPPEVYPVGRLDYDSEGLLILTDDPNVHRCLLDPVYKHEREYWVQVEGIATSEQIRKIANGVEIRVDGKLYRTKKCNAQRLQEPPPVSERNPPIRYRKTVPDSWIKIILTEGKNRQVRKMTAAAGCPTLRLIRFRIEGITLENLAPGEMRQLPKQELYTLLEIK